MQVLVILDVEAGKRFRTSVPRGYVVHEVAIAALDSRLAEAGSKLVVVDPSLVRPGAFTALLEAARSRQDVAVLVHSPLTHETARAAVLASRILPVEAIFFGSHNERDALVSQCERLLTPSVQALVLSGLSTAIAMMPPALATRVVGLFGGQLIPKSTSEMLDGLSVPVDTARDWIEAAGIAKPHLLREAALLARAYPDLGRKQVGLEQTVERVGISSVRALGRACHALTNVSARRAGRLSESDFACRTLEALLDSRIGDGAEV